MMEDAESLWTVVASVSCGGDEEQVSPVVNSVKFRLPDEGEGGRVVKVA
jgi:hypothetical protein